MNRIYEVEEILDQAVLNNQPHYLIKWKDYSHQYDTWEPLSNLTSIAEYLKEWLIKRKQKKTKKEIKGQNFKSVKQFMYPQYFPIKKSIRKQYADEILKKKKTWEKYIDNDDECIELEKQSFTQMSEVTKRKQRKPKKAQAPVFKQEDNNTESIHHKNKQQQHFKVVGFIDPSEITKITKIFISKGIVFAEVQDINGRKLNLKQELVKQYKPQLLSQFNENNKGSFD